MLKDLIINAILVNLPYEKDKDDEDIEKILSDLIKEYIDIFKELPKVGMGLETEYLLNYRISEIIFCGNKTFEINILDIDYDI